MLPIVLNQAAIAVGLTGAGEALARRRTMLADANVIPQIISPDSGAEALKGLTILFVAGLDRDAGERWARRARAQNILVNVEDVPNLCDFHVPAAVRRGDLILTVSTGGKAPGLARLIREWLERKLGEEWSGRLNELSATRAGWRGQGHPPSEVSRRTRDLVRDRDWLT